jgi:tetratricopeptide (TPR) repeat protein
MRLLEEIRNYMGDYHVKSGIYHFYRAEFNRAIGFLRKALDEKELSEADRKNARCYLTLSHKGLAERLEARGELEEAASQLRSAADASPDYPDIHCQAGRVLDRLGRRADAAKAYRRAIRRSPGYVEAHIALGDCLLADGHHEDAARAFEQALAHKLERIRRPCQAGLERLRSGDAEGSLEYFHEAFRAVPRLTDEYLREAEEWWRAGEAQKALEALDRALELSPKYSDLHNFRGIVLCGLDRLADAAEAFRRSAALSPGHLVPRLNLAFVHLRAEQFQAAEAEFMAILEVEPTEPAATAKLEELRTGRLQDARGQSR